jgi:hypothetical protein
MGRETNGKFQRPKSFKFTLGPKKIARPLLGYGQLPRSEAHGLKTGS